MWFKKKQAEVPLIKNTPKAAKRSDFVVNVVGIAFLAAIVSFALAVRLLVGTPPTLYDFAALLAAPAAATAIMALFPRWTVAVKLVIVLAIAAVGLRLREANMLIAFAFTGALLAPAVQKMDEWERAIILRFGDFHRVRGPGLFLMFPFADRIAKTVDLRIRVTDFAAETTLTRDSVTVTVDALCFWLVWDAEKAVCEVQDYEEAVVLSSKTALRNAVSKNDLSVFLERGDEIEEQIRDEVDKKTTEWGITVQHIEITDIRCAPGFAEQAGPGGAGEKGPYLPGGSGDRNRPALRGGRPDLRGQRDGDEAQEPLDPQRGPEGGQFHDARA
jgi:hypothetical protein